MAVVKLLSLLRTAVVRAEQATLWQVFLVFLAVTLSRIVEEYVLEAGHEIEPFASLLLLFLFYAVAFSGAALIAAWGAGVRLRQAAGAVAFFYPLIWLAPILDVVVSNGKGFALSYAYRTNFWDALLSFCNPCTGISPGIRIEVLLILLVFAWYAYIKTGSMLKMAAAPAVYYVFLVFNAVPQSLFRELFGYTTENIFLISEIISFYALFITGFSLYFIYREFPGYWNSFCQHLNPTRSLHYLGLTLFGMAVGFQRWTHPFPGILLTLAATLVTVFFAFQTALIVNDFFDSSLDRFRIHRRPLKTTWPLALVFFFLSVLNAIVSGYAILLLILFALGLGWAYSAPPLRFRMHLIPASIIIAACSLATFWIGYVSGFFAQESELAALPVSYSWLVFGLVLLASPFKDLKDARGDAYGSVVTLPTLFSKTSQPLTALLVGAGVLWASYWASLAAWMAVFLSALITGVIVLEQDVAKREKIVFLLHYGFLAFLALWANDIRFGLG